MSKRVVLHHAHHPDEKVYRLIHAQHDEMTQYVEVENPNYKPDEVAKLQLGIGLYEKNTNGGQPTTYIGPTGGNTNGNHNGDREDIALDDGDTTRGVELHGGDGTFNGDGHYVDGDGIPVLGQYPTPPEFDPEIHSPTKLEERKVPVHSDHQEIVWADWDEQWKGMSDADIAAKQREIVRGVFAAREQEQMAASLRERNIRNIGETDVEL